ncbi:DUF2177 family protein [Microvirga tunisiensis]|uniref:DUF2177 family protein n=2 Tax=Pannonibacter tanglangensis TaxID=2750084 RepID=A0ABW9ZJK0_9HYPH|nr:MULTISPECIES: DUF2177 family protein [unclassified Pannonibacter]NBN63239.1 DUF2177 family protein [Pannonibacter sp. XCT-34]NBN76877.1 DUF2177 family protein [Pannonibacter sp. XCT-53]
MPQILVAYGTTAAIFLIIDAIWLSQVATRFYFDRIGHLLMDKPNLGAAAVFYMLYVVGILIFAVLPALRNESFWHALVYGALFGFFAYLTYDMTNYATMRDWPFIVVVVDVLWGTVLTGVSAAGGYYLTQKFL